MKKIVFVKNCLALIILSIFFACDFNAGSYPYAEIYDLNYPIEEVKTAINKFKDKNPEYLVPKVTIDGNSTWDLIDEYSKDTKDRYIVYFYYPKDNKIILTWIRPSGKNQTSLAFVSVNKGLTLGNWREINKDFCRSENKKEVLKFEDAILNRIKEELVSPASGSVSLVPTK